MDNRQETRCRHLIHQIKKMSDPVSYKKIAQVVLRLPDRLKAREYTDAHLVLSGDLLACRQRGWIEVVNIPSDQPMYEFQEDHLIRLTQRGRQLGTKIRGPAPKNFPRIELFESDCRIVVRFGPKQKTLTKKVGFVLKTLVDSPSKKATAADLKTKQGEPSEGLMRKWAERLRCALKKLPIDPHTIDDAIVIENKCISLRKEFLVFALHDRDEQKYQLEKASYRRGVIRKETSKGRITAAKKRVSERG